MSASNTAGSAGIVRTGVRLILALASLVALVAAGWVSSQQLGPREITKSSWQYREEIVERSYPVEVEKNGKKELTWRSFQVKERIPELREDKVQARPGTREAIGWWVVIFLSVTLSIVMVVCLIAVVVAFARGSDPPQMAKETIDRVLSGIMGAFVGYLAALNTPTDAGQPPAALPPPAAAVQDQGK